MDYEIRTLIDEVSHNFLELNAFLTFKDFYDLLIGGKLLINRFKLMQPLIGSQFLMRIVSMFFLLFARIIVIPIVSIVQIGDFREVNHAIIACEFIE